jgi:iron-sulfur cluster assembly protein/iron-sulfur cluster insertion protein
MSIATSPVQIGRQPSLLTLTDTAMGKVAELLADEEVADTLALRVAVRPGGCSGYSYDMFFDTEIADNDLVWASGTVKVVVDPESAELIKGATLDYNDGLRGPASTSRTPTRPALAAADPRLANSPT